jgi:hypothetical protein
MFSKKNSVKLEIESRLHCATPGNTGEFQALKVLIKFSSDITINSDNFSQNFN